MRKLLYISITISVVIIVAAVGHYQWRARELNKSFSVARVPEIEHRRETMPVAAITSNPLVLESESSINEAMLTDEFVWTEHDIQTAKALLAQYYEIIDRVKKKYAVGFAAETDMERWIAELDRRHIDIEADIVRLEGQLERMESGLPSTDVYMPPAMRTAIESAFSTEEGVRAIFESPGGFEGFIKDLVKSHSESTE